MNELKSSNAVRLDEHVSGPRFSDRARSASLLKHCRELASSTLISTLPAVMDKLDDALFDLANRSTSNKEQSVYFDTMRQVRVRRASIETEFRRSFKDSVQSTMGRLAGSRHAASLSDTSSAGLGLVDEHDFEESLAVTNMVQKIRTSCKQPLYALERRVAELLTVDELKPEDNPFGPEAMCNAFKDACGHIDADVEVRLIILKLFDRYVGAEVERLYCEINDYLVGEGVLPEIRHHVKIQPSAAPAPGASAPDAHRQSPSMAGPQTLETSGAPIIAPVNVAATSAALLDALRQVMDVNFVPRSDDPAPHEEQHQFIGQLTSLQHGDAQGALGELGRLDISNVHAGTVNMLRELKQTTAAHGVAEIDIMMFDVVTMMFDFILDDDKMPAPMKALIGRLQIPMLKVAILDKAFFARKFHPARKLLNTIAQAAVGWSERHDRNDALYSKLESIVERVLDEFDEHVEVFTDVLSELDNFLEQEEFRAESTASTFADAIQERERLLLARRTAEEQITQCLGKASVHNVVREFVVGHWKELLFILHFEEGDTADSWTAAVQTMEDLIWSVAPKTLDHDRKHLTDILPGLLRRVRDGMDRLGIPAEIGSNFLGALKNLHVAAIRNRICVDDANDVNAVNGVSVENSDASIDNTDPQSDDSEFQWSNVATYSVEEQSLIQLAIIRANNVIYGTAESRPECAGMGTTLVAVQFHGNHLTAAHVGDARLYRLRADEFQRLTSDHSLRQQLVDKGIYTAEEVEVKVRSNIITRAVGPQASVEVDVQDFESRKGDLYLLCSDGLTDMLDDVALSEILTEHRTDLATASRVLVDAANENGGRDNISVVIARVIDTNPDSMSADKDFDGDANIEMYGLTDVGRSRSHNEDHIALDTDRGIAIVADGMGGCNAGEVASEIAVKIILESLRSGSADAVGIANAEGMHASKMMGEEITIEGLGSDTAYALEEEDEYTEIVRNLEVGSWVEFYHVDGAVTRARLAWMSPVTGRYLFTDREGMKVADSTVHGLALEIKRGNVAVIEDVPLFDRIIGTITEHLNADGARAH